MLAHREGLRVLRRFLPGGITEVLDEAFESPMMKGWVPLYQSCPTAEVELGEPKVQNEVNVTVGVHDTVAGQGINEVERFLQFHIRALPFSHEGLW